VIVVGAGPCGLSLSLALAQAGIEVTLIDRENTIDSRPRAVHLTAPGIQIFKRAGVLEDVRRAGFLPKDWTYRKFDGTPIVTVEDVAVSKSPEATIVLPIGMLCKILLYHAERNSKIFLKWSHRVVDVGQDENSAWAIIKEQDGTEKRISGDFLCGCDGGTSQVRKSLFGEKNFPGKTWDVQFVATDVSRKRGI
jgi:2-polyprenyl-6-methoxyphenol hydroxylase-like FAD-dependent oxidoreductase